MGCSAAAGLALSQGNLAEAAAPDGEASPVRMGVIGVGNRGTALLRAVLDLPGTPIVAVCVARFTVALATPGTRCNAFSTRDTQDAQVMPSTSSVIEPCVTS